MAGTARDIAQFNNLTTNFRKDPSLMRRAIRALLQQQFVFADDRGFIWLVINVAPRP